MVVNLVSLLQAAGFATRVVDPAINRALGIVILVLAIPAGTALLGFLRAGSGWRFSVGPAVFLGFVAFSLVVDYLMGIEFRSPQRWEILIPYLTLFFASIVLMGAPMIRVNRRLWLVTTLTALLLLGAMGFAMMRGVG